MLETHMKLCVTEPDFPGNFSPPNNGENGPKIGFFEFIGKLSHEFFLNLVYKEILQYLQYSCTNPILGKILVPEILAKMLLNNQIAVFSS